jgi:hypothetical protein
MIDEITASLKDMFHSAAVRACDLTPSLAPTAGEVAAEIWLTCCLPASPIQKFEWMIGAMAVLPNMPEAPPDPVFFSPSSVRAVRAARYSVEQMIADTIWPDGQAAQGPAAARLAALPRRSPRAMPKLPYPYALM